MGEPAINTEFERLTYAIGDIHGRRDLLIALLRQVALDAKDWRGRDAKPRLVFLGDYIDRGPESRGVIDLLIAAELSSAFETYYLKGNHEDVMLQFLSDPGKGDDWKRIGGLETMLSYGVTPPRNRIDVDGWEAARKKLVEVLPSAHRGFLDDLVLAFEDEHRLFVHAGVRPGRDIDEQDEVDLLWIRDSFLKHPKPYHKTVVHGHTPQTDAHLDEHRICLDTGAYVTGKLTAARFWGADVCLMSTISGT